MAKILDVRGFQRASGQHPGEVRGRDCFMGGAINTFK